MHVVWSGAEGSTDEEISSRHWALYAEFLKSRRAAFAGATVLLVAQTILSLLPSLLSRRLFDQGLLAGDYAVFRRVLLLQGACFAAGLALSAACLLAYARIGADITSRLGRRVFRHLQSLPFRYFVETKPAEYLQRLNGDVSGLQDAWGPELGQTLIAVLQILIAVPVMLFWDWRLALVSVGTLPLLAGVAFLAAKSSKKLLQDQMGASVAMSGMLHQSLGVGAYLVNLYPAAREHHRRRYDVLEAGVKEVDLRRALHSQSSSSAFELLIYAMGFLLNAYGGFLVIGRGLSLGTLVAFGTVGMFLSGPASHLARHCVFFGDALVRLKRVCDLLEAAPEESAAASASDRRPRFRESLSFENVGFSYKDGAEVVAGASFSIKAGEKAALVGPSGSGKTTAAYLLLRLFEPAAGAILLDGEDVRRFPLSAYRDLFSFVPQETVLCDGTIRENLLLSSPDASPSELEAACRAAQAHEFIQALPDGYETAVGQNGFHFSGGERQRLGIARALLRKSRVLIMDEPTSFLDPETERRLIAGLQDFLGPRSTLILITHRPSVARAMDRSFTMRGGAIEEIANGRAFPAESASLAAAA